MIQVLESTLDWDGLGVNRSNVPGGAVLERFAVRVVVQDGRSGRCCIKGERRTSMCFG